jgi:platelet-activating factor acetylhydrolase IB subunit alpha
MVLTDRQRVDLHAGIYEYLCNQGPAFQKVAEAFAEADPTAAEKGKAAAVSSGGGAVTSNGTSNSSSTNAQLHVVTIPTTMRTTTTPLLEKKWTAIPRLQKKVLELERQAAHNAKIHAHRGGGGTSGGANNVTDSSGPRRMLPRLPCSHTLQGHSSVVTCVQVHPLFTIVVSGSEDGTVKVGFLFLAFAFLVFFYFSTYDKRDKNHLMKCVSLFLSLSLAHGG